MEFICLECATPKVFAKTEGGLTNCRVCKTRTYTIRGEARRPICHDCFFFRANVGENTTTHHLDNRPDLLWHSKCQGGHDSIQGWLSEVVGPKVAKHLHKCDGFDKHSKAPYEGQPNPLSDEDRQEWRNYLSDPSAFWNNPRRWDGIEDPHKQAFWDKKEPAAVGPTIMFGAAVLAGIFLASKKPG